MCTIICKSIRPQLTVDCCMVAVVKTADSIASSPLLIRRISCCVLSLKSAQHGKSSHIIMAVCSPGRAVQFSGRLSHYCADKTVKSIGIYPHLNLIWQVLWCFVADSPIKKAMSLLAVHSSSLLAVPRPSHSTANHYQSSLPLTESRERQQYILEQRGGLPTAALMPCQRAPEGNTVALVLPPQRRQQGLIICR
jgi:hypothetical protein